MIGTAHEGSGGDIIEPLFVTDLRVKLERLGMDVMDDGQMGRVLVRVLEDSQGVLQRPSEESEEGR